jgi:hypothetical protein
MIPPHSTETPTDKHPKPRYKFSSIIKCMALGITSSLVTILGVILLAYITKTPNVFPAEVWLLTYVLLGIFYAYIFYDCYGRTEGAP